MESMVLSGVFIMLLLGVLANLWKFAVRIFTTLFFFALGVIVIGFLFGGADAFSGGAGAVTEWTAILDVVLGDGVGKRVVDAFMTFVTSTIELFKGE